MNGFKLSVADVCQIDWNTYYPHRKQINEVADLVEAVKHDHVAGEMRDNVRGDGRFVCADVVQTDLDNTHANDPDSWLTLKDIMEAFPGVTFYASRSRNYMRQKKKISSSGEITYFEPREKYHLYLPLSKIYEDEVEYQKLILTIVGLFPYFDCSAVDTKHFFYGVPEPHVELIEGELTIDQYIDNMDPQILRDTMKGNVEALAKQADTDEGRKAVKKLREFLHPSSAANRAGNPNSSQGDGDQRERLQWVEEWADRFEVELGRRYDFSTESHPDAIAICVLCPWEDEHSMNGPDNETVIIIDRDGKLNFLCRHSHGYMYGWKEYREAIEERYFSEHPDELKPPPLPNLDNILNTIDSGCYVCFVSREADAGVLRALGRTTLLMDTWRKEYSDLFKGARVNFYLTKDPKCLAQAEQIRRDIKVYAYCTRFIRAPDDAEGLAEWIGAGNGPEELKELTDNQGCEFAPWIDVTITARDVKKTVNADKLSRAVSETVDYIIVREGGDDRDIVFLYSDGCYRRTNKGGMKGEVRKFLPPGKATENTLNNTFQMLFSRGAHIHAWDELDRREDIINVENGLFYLFEGELKPHDNAVLCTRQLHTQYDEGAVYMPYFDKFINDMCMGEDGFVDDSRKAIIQELTGLILSNIPGFRTKLAVVLYSPNGDTGKSVFFGLMADFLGAEAIANIPMQSMNPNERFILGTIQGTRLIAIGDQSGSEVKDTAVFKQLTGGDIVKIEAKGQQPIYHRYNGVVTIACNVLPTISDDKGSHLFGRMLIVPLINSIPRNRQDPELLDKLCEEKTAIFNWGMEGLRRLKSNHYRFTPCKAAEEAGREYRSTLDTVFEFLSVTCIITGDKADGIRKTQFEDSYETWVEFAHRTPVKRKNIVNRMAAIGIPKKKGNIGPHRGVDIYRGVKWRKEYEDGFLTEHICEFMRS